MKRDKSRCGQIHKFSLTMLWLIITLSCTDTAVWAAGRTSNQPAQSPWSIAGDNFSPPGIKSDTPQLESPTGLVAVTLQQYKEKCLPLPDNIAEVTSGTAYREGSYSAAAGIIKSAPNPCEASVELKLFLEGQKGEWTMGSLAAEGKDMGLRIIVSSIMQKYIIGMAINPTLTIGIKLSSLVDEELKKRSAAAPIKASNELFKKTRGMNKEGVDQIESGLKSKAASYEKDLEGLTVKYGQRLEGYRPNHPYDRLNPSTAWQIFLDKELEFARQEAAERANILYEIASLEIQRGVLNQYRRPLLEKSCDEMMASLVRDCPQAKKSETVSKPPEPPVISSSLIKADMNVLNGCLCRCTINPTIGVGATYDPKAWKNASPSCDDARYGPCVGFGLGCWREHMRSDGECFEQCVAAASAKPQEVKTEIYKTRFKAYNDFLGEARSIIEEYLSYKARFSRNGSGQRGLDKISGHIQLAGNFSDEAALGPILFAATSEANPPSVYAEMVREKNRRGDPDRALGLVRSAESVMPDRKASGETTNILAEFAIIMSKASLNIVTEFEFDEGLYLLRKAAEFYKVGKSNPLGENIQRLIGNFEKWKEDWQILKSQIPVCQALIKDKRVCACDKLNSEKITPAANSLTIYEFASSEKWSISTANGTPRPLPEKDKIYKELKDTLSRAKNVCANNPAMHTKEMKDLTDYETRKSLEKSPYINQEDLKKNSAPVICDTRAVKYAEKLLSTPGLCDCQQEKIKGILDTAKKDERPLVIEFSADKSELSVKERVLLSLSIKGGVPPFSADMTGDYSYTQQSSEARGFNINYQAERAGTNTFYVTVVDSCGESGSKKIYVNVKLSGTSKKQPPAFPETGQRSSPTQTPVNTKNAPPVYDPTEDPNISTSGHRNIDIGKVDELGNDFRDKAKGPGQSDQKKDNKQAPVAQPDSYTKSMKEPDTGGDPNSNFQPSYPPVSSNPRTDRSDWTKNRGDQWDRGDRRDRGNNSRGDSTSSPTKNCDSSQKQAAYQEGVKCGQKAKQSKVAMSNECKTASQKHMNTDTKMGWGSCLYSGFDEGYRAGLGTTAGGGSGEVMAELENRAGESVHIFADGQDNFGPQNKLSPGAKKTVSVRVPKGGGYVKFLAGRNGQKLAECKWEYTPDSWSRVPVVKFSAPKSLTCTVGLR